MIKKLTLFIVPLFLAFTMIFSTGCGNSEEDGPVSDTVKVEEKLFQISGITGDSKFKSGDTISFKVEPMNGTSKCKQIQVLINGKYYSHTDTENVLKVDFPTAGKLLGRQKISAVVSFDDKKDQKYDLYCTLYSNTSPKKYSYKVVKTYPHDPDAYTQGLIFENGKLYEGTGLYGKSNIREVNLSDGKVTRQHKLEDDYFGEGITSFGNKFYQISWQSGNGWVYTKKDFVLERKFNYPIEGWGLTHNDSCLLMSDGSNNIFFMDTTTFRITHKIQVYDEEAAVPQLNELEMINGTLWANIYQSDLIVQIDPATGAVLGELDLKGILSYNDRTGNEDVLNGIAYDKILGKMYVTGKKWPKLFEISID